MLPTFSSTLCSSLVLIDGQQFLRAFVRVSRQNEATSINALNNDKLLACVLCFPAVLIKCGARLLIQLG